MATRLRVLQGFSFKVWAIGFSVWGYDAYPTYGLTDGKRQQVSPTN